MQLPKCHFVYFETFAMKIPYYHSPKTLIVDNSETVNRWAKRSSILTLRGNMQLPKSHFGCFETFATKIPYYHLTKSLIADNLKTVDHRAKQRSISTSWAFVHFQTSRKSPIITADILKTVNHRAKQSSISTPKGFSNLILALLLPVTYRTLGPFIGPFWLWKTQKLFKKITFSVNLTSCRDMLKFVSWLL